jgi:hypothetical protein
MKALEPSQQSQRGEQSYKSKHMVAMQMGEEDGSQMGEVDVRTAQSHLGSFGTIEHEELLSHVHHLHRTEVLGCWQGCTTAQDVNLKFFH